MDFILLLRGVEARNEIWATRASTLMLQEDNDEEAHQHQSAQP
jgi:hypothetical protein